MKNVIIYTTPTCHYCKMTKALFQEHGVTYSERDVMSDVAARKEMVDKSGQMGVPVTTIDNEVVVGFDEERFRSLLGI